MSKRGIARLAAAGVAAGLGSLALGVLGVDAAGLTIGFDDLPDGTVVTTQYQSQGVVFGPTPTGGSYANATVALVMSAAPSPPNVLRVGGCGSASNAITGGRFSAPQQSVTVKVGSTSGGTGNWNLTVYNAAGAVVGSASSGTFSGTAFHSVSATAPANDIAFFRIEDTTCLSSSPSIDDFNFVAAPPPPPPTAEPVHGVGIVGPGKLVLGEPAVFTAQVSGPVVRYLWDLDGSGRFATDTGADPALETHLKQLGNRTVRVHAVGAGGDSADLTKGVSVVPPPLAQLAWTPHFPRPGQKVHFSLPVAQEKGRKVAYYAWEIGGLKPLTHTLSRAGGAAKTTALGQQITLSTAQPTAGPALTRTFTKTGTFPVEVSVVGRDGFPSTARANVRVSKAAPGARMRAKGAAVIPKSPADVKSECAADRCAALSTPDDWATNDKLFLHADIDKVQLCVETNKEEPLSSASPTEIKLEAKPNLGYPAGFIAEQGGEQQQQEAFAAAKVKSCALLGSRVVFWDFDEDVGDPTGTEPAAFDPNETQDHTFTSHTWKAPKSYTITMVAAVEVLKPSVKTTQDIVKALLSGHRDEVVEERFVKVTRTINIADKTCGVLKLNTIPVRALSNQAFDPFADPVGDSCFLKKTLPGGTHTVYQPYLGTLVSLNGILVANPNGAVVVDPAGSQVTTLGGGELQLTFVDPQVRNFIRASYPLGHTPSVVVPPPADIPDLKLGPVSPLPTYPGKDPSAIKIGGLKAKSLDVYMRASTSAVGRVAMQLPPPFNGEDPVQNLGANARTAASPFSGTKDFFLELPDVNLGAFMTKGVTLSHFISGAWSGGGSLSIDAGFTLELDAPDLPPESLVVGDVTKAPKCEDIAAPSGLGLNPDGSFAYGGAIVKTNVINILGVVGIPCIAARGTASPFGIEGRLALQVPATGTPIITGDICAYVSFPLPGENVNGCGSGYHNAQQFKVLWIRSTGVFTLVQLVPFTAFFELEKGQGGDLFVITMGGGIDYDFGIAKVNGQIAGKVWSEPVDRYQFQGVLGVDGPGPLDFSVTGAVTSIGAAACIEGGPGFKYVWATKDGTIQWWRCRIATVGVLFENLLPLQGGLAASPRGRAPLGASAQARSRVPRGLDGVSFRATGLDAAPRVTVTGPGGLKLVDDGSGYQKVGRSFVVHIPTKNQTLVSIPNPRAGAYRIDAQPGSAKITKLSREDALPATRVLATVTGRGANRGLKYLHRPLKGEKITFVEEGRGVTRTIGVATRATGSFRLPPGFGFPGLRRIYALPEQDGFPGKKILVASYVAVAPPKPGRPAGLRARYRAGRRPRLDVGWRRAALAFRYELTVRYGGGRTEIVKTRARFVRLSAFRPEEGALISVKAFTRRGAEGRAATLRIVRRALPRPRIRL